MADDPDMIRLLEQIGRNTQYLTNKNPIGSFNTPSTKGAHEVSTKAFNTGLKLATSSLRLLHGSADEAISAFTRMLGYGALGGAVTALIENLRSTSRTYGQMTAVGVNFSGSMFKMQQMAGASGLSLEDFAKQVTHNSVLIAQMGDSQIAGVSSFTAFQKGVRDNLKGMGYYGMTLNEVNEASGEFAESLRESGQWNRMTDKQQTDAGSNFVKNINLLSAATGKNREEMMKSVNAAMRNPLTAAHLSLQGPDQRAVFTQIASTFASSAGDLGPMMTQFFSDAVGRGHVQYTTEGKNLIDSGLGDVASIVQEGVERVRKGGEWTEEDQFKQFSDAQRMHEIIGPRIDNLRNLANAGNESAQTAVKMYNATQGINADKEMIKWRAAKALSVEGITRGMTLLPTFINETLGKFREGFYRAFLGTTEGKDGSAKIKAFEDKLEDLQKKLLPFGAKLGEIAQDLLDGFIARLPQIETALDAFLISAKTVFPYFLDALYGVGHLIVNIRDGIASVLEFFGFAKDANDAKGKASGGMLVAALLIPFGGLGLAIGAVRLTFGLLGGAISKVITGFGRLAALRGGGGDGFIGPPTAPGAKPMGRFGRTASLVTSIGGIIGGAIAADLLKNKILGMLPDSVGKNDTVQGVAEVISNLGGAVIGEKLASTVFTRVAAWVAPAFLTTPAAVAAAVLLMGAAGAWATKNQAEEEGRAHELGYQTSAVAGGEFGAGTASQYTKNGEELDFFQMRDKLKADREATKQAKLKADAETNAEADRYRALRDDQLPAGVKVNRETGKVDINHTQMEQENYRQAQMEAAGPTTPTMPVDDPTPVIASGLPTDGEVFFGDSAHNDSGKQISKFEHQRRQKQTADRIRARAQVRHDNPELADVDDIVQDKFSRDYNYTPTAAQKAIEDKLGVLVELAIQANQLAADGNRITKGEPFK